MIKVEFHVYYNPKLSIWICRFKKKKKKQMTRRLKGSLDSNL